MRPHELKCYAVTSLNDSLKMDFDILDNFKYFRELLIPSTNVIFQKFSLPVEFLTRILSTVSSALFTLISLVFLSQDPELCVFARLLIQHGF